MNEAPRATTLDYYKPPVHDPADEECPECGQESLDHPLCVRCRQPVGICRRDGCAYREPHECRQTEETDMATPERTEGIWDQVAELRQQGLTWKEVGEKVGATQQQMYAWRRDMLDEGYDPEELEPQEGVGKGEVDQAPQVTTRKAEPERAREDGGNEDPPAGNDQGEEGSPLQKAMDLVADDLEEFLLRQEVPPRVAQEVADVYAGRLMEEYAAREREDA